MILSMILVVWGFLALFLKCNECLFESVFFLSMLISSTTTHKGGYQLKLSFVIWIVPSNFFGLVVLAFFYNRFGESDLFLV